MAIAAGIAGAAALVYGALHESKKLVLERRTLRLPLWPTRLDGYKIALLGDLHLRDKYTVALAQDAIAMALDEEPDMVVLAGDLIGYWKRDTPRMLGETLEPLLLMNGSVLAVAGNHEYWGGAPEMMRPVLDLLNIKLLINDSWRHDGITWAGIDSMNSGRPDPLGTLAKADGEPVIAIWHEPDAVEKLPGGCALMLAGHSHGGQFWLPGGILPMTSRNGRKYLAGFYPNAPTPLYVTRGVGTTGPPSRLFCPPEVALLTVNSYES